MRTFTALIKTDSARFVSILRKQTRLSLDQHAARYVTINVFLFQRPFLVATTDTCSPAARVTACDCSRILWQRVCTAKKRTDCNEERKKTIIMHSAPEKKTLRKSHSVPLEVDREQQARVLDVCSQQPSLVTEQIERLNYEPVLPLTKGKCTRNQVTTKSAGYSRHMTQLNFYTSSYDPELIHPWFLRRFRDPKNQRKLSPGP